LAWQDAIYLGIIKWTLIESGW